MPTLYSHPLSTYAQRVHIALLEKGVTWDVEQVDMGKKQHRSPEYLAINPYGRVPALVDGALKIVESSAVLDYHEATNPAPPLIPDSAESRAEVEERRQQRDAEAEEQGDEHLELAVHREPPAEMEFDARRATDAQHEQGGGDRPEALEDERGRGHRLAAQEIDRDQHRDDREVLREQHGGDVLRDLGILIGRALEQPQHDRRAAEADHEPEEHDAWQLPVEPGAEQRDTGQRESDLQSRSDERDLPARDQRLRRDLHAHEEQQEHDSQGPETVEDDVALDESRDVRAQENPCEEVRDDERLVQSLEHVAERDDHHDRAGEVQHQGIGVHDASLPECRGVSRAGASAARSASSAPRAASCC